MAHDGQKLVDAWVTPEFAGALSMLAAMRGESRSDVLRKAISQEALRDVEESDADDDGGDES